jgi:putative peptidoglycan lipid II flippase
VGEIEQFEGGGNTSHAIVRASAIVMLAHGLLKLLSLILTMTLSGVYGATLEMDVYTTTFVQIIGALFFIGEESFGPVLLPLFMEVKSKENEGAAWKFASNILTLQTFLLILLTAALVFVPELFIRIATQWYSSDVEQGTEKIALAKTFLRIMGPGLIGLSAATTTYKILNGYKKFFLAAFGDASVRIVTIAAVSLPYVLRYIDPSLGSASPMYVAAGALIGCWAKLGTHAVALRKQLHMFRPRVDFSDPMLKKFAILIAPLLVGIVFAKARDIFNYSYVLSALETGTVAINNWGKKIYDTLINLVPYAVSIAMFPYFCEMVDKNDMKKLGDTITKSLRIILFLLLPMSVGVMILSIPLARVLYQHGASDFQTAYMAGAANAAYMLGLPFMAAEMILMQAFFSSRRTVVLTIIGIAWSTISMAISYTGIILLGPELIGETIQAAGVRFNETLGTGQISGLMGILIVGVGYAFTRAGKTVTLGVVLKRRVPLFAGKESVVYFVKLAILTLGVAAAVYGAKQIYEIVMHIERGGVDIPKGLGLKTLMAGELVAGGIAGVAVLLGLSLVLKMEEVPMVYRWVKERLARRRRC